MEPVDSPTLLAKYEPRPVPSSRSAWRPWADPFIPVFNPYPIAQVHRTAPPSVRLYFYDNPNCYHTIQPNFIMCPPDDTGSEVDAARVFRLDNSAPPRYAVLPITYLPWKGNIVATLQNNPYFAGNREERVDVRLQPICTVPGCRIAEAAAIIQHSECETVGGGWQWAQRVLSLLHAGGFFDEERLLEIGRFISRQQLHCTFSRIDSAA